MAAAVDVPALPGTTNINSDTYETELLVDSLSSALLTNGKESGKGVHLDTNWKRPSRHALMRVKNGEGLLKLVGGLDKAKTSAFDNMSLYIEAFMVKRHYPDDKIDDYYNQGTLVRLMYKTYDYYNQLLGKLRELYYKHFQRWEGSPAAALLDHHSEKLLFIRCNSVNRTTHLLRSYTYLRDAAADGFSANEVIESLWERVSEIHQEI
ncbi:unnamed protein product [Cylindrotheca closterium]|uniref:Uncharacterized protein n=1 Tax=Cylindrotheca closterium TaxID=2856 RepID=A0AAD2FXQ5_9STRA|nr:unnamed protein product [Cylindrotheca closterium]